MTIQPKFKPLYHALCVFGSGYMVMLLAMMKTLAKEIRLEKSWKAVFGPLIASSLKNGLEREPEGAMTGPAARGDAETVRLHLEALRKSSPKFLPVYASLGRAALETMQKEKRVSRKKSRGLDKLFKEFS